MKTWTCVRRRFVSTCALVAAGFAGTGAARAATHEIEGRVQIGFVYDSNVLEALSEAQADQALQLFGAADYRLHASERLDLNSTIRLGLHRYREIPDDSRVIGEGAWSVVYRVRNTAIGSTLELQGRDYSDSTSSRGYGVFKAGAFLRSEVGGIGVEITGARTELDYRVTPGREQVGNRIDLALDRRLSEDLRLRMQIGSGSFDFNRPRIQLIGEALEATGGAQVDEFTRFNAEATYIRRVYVSLGYTFLTNDSNSFGSAFRYHRIDAAFRTRIPDTQISLGVLARLESRAYRQDLSGFSVINFDSEREENNGVTVEIGRPLLPDTSVKFRIGWHHSESVFRDRLYDKLLAESHLEWRF